MPSSSDRGCTCLAGRSTPPERDRVGVGAKDKPCRDGRSPQGPRHSERSRRGSRDRPSPGSVLPLSSRWPQTVVGTPNVLRLSDNRSGACPATNRARRLLFHGWVILVRAAQREAPEHRPHRTDPEVVEALVEARHQGAGDEETAKLTFSQI